MSTSPRTTSVTTFLGLGSNINPKKSFIDFAIRELKEMFPADFRASSYYNTAPYKGVIQNSYLNCCVSFCTFHPPQCLLQLTQALEKIMGRNRAYNHWESRVIDIDILLYGTDKYQFNNLIIPHYDLSNRDFFLIPLLELDSNLVNPTTGKTLSEELAELPTESKTVIKKI